MEKLKSRTKSNAFHKGGGFFSVWKNRFAVLLSVTMRTGSEVPQNLCPIYFNANYNVRNSLV